MRVLIYTHVFPPNVGGVETYARLLSEGLAKRTGTTGTEKIEVTVATHTPAESGYDAKFSFARQNSAVIRKAGGVDCGNGSRTDDEGCRKAIDCPDGRIGIADQPDPRRLDLTKA